MRVEDVSVASPVVRVVSMRWEDVLTVPPASRVAITAVLGSRCTSSGQSHSRRNANSRASAPVASVSDKNYTASGSFV